MESHNIGLHKELAMFDNSARTNAVQAMGTGLGKGPTSGLVAFYGGHGLKVAVGLRALGYNTTYSNGGMDTDGTNGNLFRITYDAPSLAGWNLSIGAFGISGTEILFENLPDPAFTAAPWYTTGRVYDFEITSSGFDLQAQGAIAGMNTQILLTNVSGYEFAMTDTVTDTERELSDISATSFEMQIMPTAAWGIRLGQINYTDNATSTNDCKTTNLGVNFN